MSKPSDHLDLSLIPEDARELFEVQESSGIPKEYSLACLLTVVGSIGGAKFSTEFYPRSPIYPNINAVLVGPPSIKKTPATSFYTTPLQEINDNLYKDYEKEVEAYKTAIARNNKNKKTEIKRPIFKPLIFNTATEEAVELLLPHNPSPLFLADELQSVFDSLTRYNGGSSSTFHLTNYSNQGNTRIRVGEGSSTYKYSAVPVLGGVQPEVYYSLFQQKEIDNGLTVRFLPFGFFSSPPSFPLPDPRSLSEAQVAAIEGYKKTVLSFYDSLLSVKPSVLELNGEAYQLLCEHRKDIHEKEGKTQSKLLLSFYGKKDTNLPRFAILSRLLKFMYSPDRCWVVPLESHRVLDEEDVMFAMSLHNYLEAMFIEAEESRKHSAPIPRRDLVQFIRTSADESGVNITDEDIGKVCGYSKGNVSKILKAYHDSRAQRS